LTLEAQIGLIGSLRKYVNLGQKFAVREPCLLSWGCHATELLGVFKEAIAMKHKVETFALVYD
jgi:hypothetical protein